MAELLPDGSCNVDSLRQFMPIRLIVFDLDGTLIPADLSQKIQEFARRLRRHQVLMTIATGRTLCGVAPMLEKLELPRGTPLILYNGSVVVANQTFNILSQKNIEADCLRRVLEIARKYSFAVLAYFYNDPITELARFHGNHEYVIGWSLHKSMQEWPLREFNGALVQWQNTMEIDESWKPSAVLLDTTANLEATATVETELGFIPGISTTRSGASYIEIRPYGSNKGVALERVVRTAGISLEEVLAVGDNDNDAEMLARAGIGVAISTASPAAIAHSDYICRHGPFGGVVEVLRLVKTAKRYFGNPTLSE